MSGVRCISFAMPFPVYCRTSVNKIVYCNKIFAAMYGMKPNDMHCTYNNALLSQDMDLTDLESSAAIKKRELHNHRKAMRNNGAVSYTESGVLTDGTEVQFNCIEMPVQLPSHHGAVRIVQ